MQRIPLNATERDLLGKKVKTLRKDGFLPAHVFGHGLETEHVTVNMKELLPVLNEAGETGLIDLKIGEEKIRPVMVRGIQFDPRTGNVLHVDFYQVNLKQKVRVPVPIVIEGDEPEIVHQGEATLLQTLSEIEVEALPTDLIEEFVVNISSLQNIDDAITIGQLNYDHDKITIDSDPDEIIVKLDAIKIEVVEEPVVAEGEESAVAEGEGGEEGEAAEGAEESTESKEESGE